MGRGASDTYPAGIATMLSSLGAAPTTVMAPMIIRFHGRDVGCLSGGASRVRFGRDRLVQGDGHGVGHLGRDAVGIRLDHQIR